MTESEGHDALFGTDDAVEEVDAVEEQDDTELEESEEEESSESEGEESDEEEEPEEKSRKGNPDVPLKALRKEVSSLKEDLDTANRMLRDRDFIAKQAERLGLKVQDPTQAPPKPGEEQVSRVIPDAPFYSNTPEGRADRHLDMRGALSAMPELANNDALARMVEGQVAIGASYAQAVREVQRLIDANAQTAKKEGAKERDTQIANKQRVATKPAPGVGKPSKEAETVRRLKGATTQDAKMQAGHDLLFS